MAKIGEGHAEAMARLGLKELRNAFNPSKESVADSELGVYGTATQMDINADRGNIGMTMDSLDKEAQADFQRHQQEHGKEGQDRDRGMER